MGVRSSVGGGLTVRWGAEHKSQGELVVRMASVDPPAWPGCNCVGKYLWQMLKFWLLMYYHTWRVLCAERNRRKVIPMKYRTGEPSPTAFFGLVWELVKLRVRLWLR